MVWLHEREHAGRQPKSAGLKITAVESDGVRLFLAAPPPDLAPYVSLYYRTDVAAGVVAEDCVPPEWANLRTGCSPVYEAALGKDPLRQVPPIVLAGPTSRAVRLRIGEGHFWGIGLLPLGFQKFLGMSASDHADRVYDLAEAPAAAPLLPMLRALQASPAPMEEGAALMTRSLRALLGRPLPQAEAILTAHRALVTDAAGCVTDLAGLLGVSTRTLERFCRRNFGFNPQLLLRRQRFLRSLARFMIDPSMKWTATLDSHYHDQAHFLRDFRSFMGMLPSEYAAMPHPITLTAVRARRATRKEAMQVLHEPDVPSSAGAPPPSP